MIIEYTNSLSGKLYLALKPDFRCKKCFRTGFKKFVAMAGLSDKEYNNYISIVDEALKAEHPPPLAGREAWALLKKESKVGNDIFASEKAFFTKELLKYYYGVKNSFIAAGSPHFRALSASTWCNLIDVGQGKPLPDIQELLNLFSSPLFLDERELFMENLKTASTLLVLGDNAGETVFDRLFLELINFSGKVFYMTRGEPVMNDATVADAELAGLHNVVEIVSSNSDIPGFIPSYVSGKAKSIYNSADIILSKGQGNLEGLLGKNDQRVYFSFVVKCDVVSDAVNVPLGSGVFSRFLNVKGNNYADL